MAISRKLVSELVMNVFLVRYHTRYRKQIQKMDSISVFVRNC